MKDNKAFVIKFENNNISVFSPNPFSVKALKKRLAKELGINEELIVLMDESKILEDNEILNEKEISENLILFSRNNFGESLYMKPKKTEETVSSLIMKVTGAKTQLEQKNISRNRNNQFNNTGEILNEIFSHSPLIFPGISTNSVRVQQELQNLFMPLINQQLVSSNNNQVSQNNQQSSNNVPNNMNITIINLSQGNNSETINAQSTNNQQGQQNIRFPFPFIHQGSIVVDEEKVKTLSELGFSDESSRKALMYSANDLDAAAELCITGRVDELPSHPNMQTFIFPFPGNDNNNNDQENENNN
jgi:hypothetical protein